MRAIALRFGRTVAEIMTYPFRYLRFRRKRAVWAGVLALDTVEARFNAIYADNMWESAESVSGPGSTLHSTANLRGALPGLIAKYGIRSIFDAPCGDFSWMRRVLPDLGVRYTGGDIVKALVDRHTQDHGNDATLFVHIDLVRDAIPKADLMICRDCLFHFSFAHARAVLENFVTSGTAFLLTSSHKTAFGFTNKDIVTGDFRRINLFAAPYGLPDPPLERIADWVAPAPRREICLWSRDQVAAALAKAW